MPRKRGVRARPLEAQHDTSETVSPTTECSSSASFLPTYEEAALPAVPPSQAPVDKCSAAVGEPATGLAADRPCISVHPTSMESTDAPELNDSASVFASQEDACAFHSPRSAHGDVAEDVTHLISRPIKEGAMSRALVDTSGLGQAGSSRGAEADASGPSSIPSSPRELPASPLELQQIQQQTQEQREQEQHHDQKQQEHQQWTSAPGDDAATRRISPVTESEGEWISIEEPYRNNGDTAPHGLPSSCPEALHTSDREELPAASAVSLSVASLSQSVVAPVCIGSAIQAEVGTGVDSSSAGLLPEIVATKASERDWGSAGFSPAISATGRFPNASPRGLLSRISRYAMSLARSASGRGKRQSEPQDPPAFGADEVNALPSQTMSSPGDRGRLLQSIGEWHKCFLEMYGGPVEDITRLALQVLPAQATGDMLLLVLHFV